MKVTYNWLKDFVEIKIPAAALAEKLTMAGLEVTSLEEKEGDFVFEIEVTSNRPDWLSVAGIAREVAAITGKKLKSSQVTGHRSPVTGKNVQRATCNVQPFVIAIENKKDCPLYTAKIIKNVKVCPSPDWLKKRLELIGCRSVNNIVDITNYVLFERGEPLHAFDLDKLKGSSIVVRRAKAGEKITTIDGQERALNPDILVIADAEKAVAVAGVMGSKDTEVTQGTQNILLEAAAFNPIVVRHGRRALGIQSDSSYRFERGVNLELVQLASWQAAELIKKLAGGDCISAKNSGLAKTKRKSIILESSSANKILGTNIPAVKIKRILNSLGFKTKTKPKNRFSVEIPSHRPDVNSQIDLIEEIARVYGYENIPQTLPAVKPQICVSQERDIVSLIKNILVCLGLSEVITYSLTDKNLLQAFNPENSNSIEILNPLNKEQEILRPSLIPSLAASVALNLNQKQEGINIFEVAKVFLQRDRSPQEELRLGICLCGTKPLFFKQGQIKEPIGLLHLKGIAETLFQRLGISNYDFNPEEASGGIAVYAGKDKIGCMAKIEGALADKLDIKNKDTFALELSLDKLASYINLNKKFSPLPVYPGISRDISLILKEETSVGEILKAISEKGKPLLTEARVLDYYKGRQIPPGFKGLTVTCLYRSGERTLTETEILPLHSDISSLLREKFAAQLRESAEKLPKIGSAL